MCARNGVSGASCLAAFYSIPPSICVVYWSSYAVQIDSVLVFWGYDAARIEADDNLITTVNNKSVSRDYRHQTPPSHRILSGALCPCIFQHS